MAPHVVIRKGAACEKVRAEFKGTFTEFVEFAEKRTSPSAYWRSSMPPSFCMDSAEETLHKAKAGFPEAVERIAKAREVIFRNAEGDSPFHYTPDLTGHYFDVGEAIIGIPEHWYTPERERMQREPVTVHFNSSCSWMVEQDDIIRRGAVVSEVLSRLQSHGPVEVIAHVHTQYYILDVAIDMREGWSVNTVAFALAHPGFLRRLGFSVMEQLIGEDWIKPRGYGRPGKIEGVERGPNVIVIDHEAEGDKMLRAYSTDAKCAAQAEKLMAQIAEADAAANREV